MESNEELIYFAKASSVKENDYIMINDYPCVCVEKTTNKTGKHGSCKCHFCGLDIFTGNKHKMMCKSTADVKVPRVAKREYQLLNIDPNDEYLSLLDLETNKPIEIKILDDKLKNRIMEEEVDNDENQIICRVIMAMNMNAVVDIRVQKE